MSSRMRSALATRLLERASPVLFHNTTAFAMTEILRTGRMNLTFSSFGSPDRNRIGRAFHGSFSRIRWGGYDHTASRHGSVVFTVDGDRLNHNHKVVPYDYWQHKFGSSHTMPSADEQEDRIISNKESIDILKFITEVSVLNEFGNPQFQEVDKRCRYIVRRCRELGIPCFVYDDHKAFKLGDKRKAVQVPEEGEDPELQDTSIRSYDRHALLIPKFIADPLSDSDEMYEMVRKLSSFDWKHAVSADLHNIKSTTKPELRKALQWIARLEARSGKSVYEHLQKGVMFRQRIDNLRRHAEMLRSFSSLLDTGEVPKGWGGLTRDRLVYYLRPSGVDEVDAGLEDVGSLLRDGRDEQASRLMKRMASACDRVIDAEIGSYSRSLRL